MQSNKALVIQPECSWWHNKYLLELVDINKVQQAIDDSDPNISEKQKTLLKNYILCCYDKNLQCFKVLYGHAHGL